MEPRRSLASSRCQSELKQLERGIHASFSEWHARSNQPVAPDARRTEIDEVYGIDEGEGSCIVCHKWRSCLVETRRLV
jgi:hypothetical protein